MHYKKRKIEETIINRRECDTSVYLDILVEYGNKRIIIGKVSGEGGGSKAIFFSLYYRMEAGGDGDIHAYI